MAVFTATKLLGKQYSENYRTKNSSAIYVNKLTSSIKSLAFEHAVVLLFMCCKVYFPIFWL